MVPNSDIAFLEVVRKSITTRTHNFIIVTVLLLLLWVATVEIDFLCLLRCPPNRVLCMNSTTLGHFYCENCDVFCETDRVMRKFLDTKQLCHVGGD